MLKKFLEYCRQKNLIKLNDSFLLSVSGGADSIFMLKLFNEIKNVYSLKLGIAYIDHKIRDVKKEIIFVKNFSKIYNIPFYLAEINISKKSSLEELLRIKRLKALKEIAKKNNFSKIALAHTRDDQAETILMRFLKGTSLRGLSGIKPINNNVFIHPILIFSKEEILNFLKENKIPFLQDPTNYNFSFLRNKLRLKILPFLEKEINPNLKENMIKMASNLLEDENYLKEKARLSLNEILVNTTPFPHFDRQKFLKLDEAIKNRILISILMDYNFRWESKHINLIKDFIEKSPNKNAKFLNKNLTFISTCDNIYICPFNAPPEPIFLKKGKKIHFAGWRSSIYFSKKAGDFLVEEDMISKLKLTSIIHNKNFKKDLKKLKIPYPLKNYLPIISIGNKIIWIPGFYKEEFSYAKNKIFMRWNYEVNKNT